MKARFPNLVVGMITRDSVRRALTNGITAEQVRARAIHYIRPIHSSTAPDVARTSRPERSSPNIASHGVRPRLASAGLAQLALLILSLFPPGLTITDGGSADLVAAERTFCLSGPSFSPYH